MSNLVRRVGRFGFGVLARLESGFDRAFLVESVPTFPHRTPQELLRLIQTPAGGRARVLEIGSREVTGPSQAKAEYGDAVEYIGFDYYPGRNVDIVGDVHRLSSYFKEDAKFDIVFTSACFEHFAMPWRVALEIAKILKVGGIVYVRTHFSFGTHERPWNFFQFSDMGLRVLFPSALGFECLEAGMSNPIVGRFSALADKKDRYQPILGLYSGSEYLGRKVRDEPAFDWNQVTVDEVIGGTTYPAPKGN